MMKGDDMTMSKHSKYTLGFRLAALALTLIMLFGFAAAEDTSQASESEWVTFFLMCNEGMTNEGGNVGNTMMIVGMNPNDGRIRLMMLTWDTFVQYEGYDYPQLISTPYRSEGPDGTMLAFNANFGMDINHYISLNFLNLAGIIDDYGGVNVDVTRAERNALNGMVASKKWSLQNSVESNLLTELLIEKLAEEYYLNDYGPDTHLNGLQAVAYGWLQYDSVYNCCEREVHVNGNLFESVAKTINDNIAFYTDEYPLADDMEQDTRRQINLDDMSADDKAFLRRQLDPIFSKSFNNMTEDEIMGISVTLARVAFLAYRQGVNLFENIDYTVFPLEAQNEYDIVAGTKGHLVDYEANHDAMVAFLFAD